MQFKHRMMSAGSLTECPLNLRFLDHADMFEDQSLFRADMLHLNQKGQALLRQIFRGALVLHYTYVSRVLLSSELCKGRWNHI